MADRLIRANRLIPEDCLFSYQEIVESNREYFNQMLEDFRTQEGQPLRYTISNELSGKS